MTSAWKLLYIWKSRGGRSSGPAAAADSTLDSSRDSNRRRTRNGHGSRSHHRDDPNQSNRHQSARTHARNLCHRAPHPEHESAQLDRRASGDLATSNGNIGVPVGVPSWMREIRNNQLPDSVIQARQRLVERLGSVSLAGARESTRAVGIYRDELAENHALRNDDFVDRGEASSRDWFDDNLRRIEFTLDESKRKLSGVSWEDVSNLHHEVFGNAEETEETRASPECCSICLESFCDGDGLIRLHCGHRFHPACLQPWLQTCSCCPYCRANIP